MRRLSPSNQNRGKLGSLAIGRARRGIWQRQKWRLIAGFLCAVYASCIGYLVYDSVERGDVRTARALFWNGVLAFSERQGLVVQDVMVDGRGHTGRDEIWQALQLERGTPILGVDLDAAQANLQILPWVAMAKIERRLPGMIYVHLTEREPQAIWQYKGELNVIDENGAVILNADPKQFATLPIVVGADAPGAARILLQQLAAHSELRTAVQSAVRIGQRRWDLHLQSGMLVKLPEENAELALERLMQMQTAQQVLQQNYTTIDLRLEDRVFLQKPGEPAPSTGTKGEQGV